MVSRILALAALAATLSLSTGCLSFQSYGSPTMGHTISPGASKADVLFNMGEPNSIYQSNDTEVFIYRGLKGQSWFGLFAKVKRNDTVVVMDGKGTVINATPLETPVEVGSGWSIIAPRILDATHPFPSSDLAEGPLNYKSEFTEEKK